MRFLNLCMGSLALFTAILIEDQTNRAFLYSASAANFCSAIMPKDEKS